MRAEFEMVRSSIMHFIRCCFVPNKMTTGVMNKYGKKQIPVLMYRSVVTICESNVSVRKNSHLSKTRFDVCI